MVKRAGTHCGGISISDVAQIPISSSDLLKAFNKALTLLVVEKRIHIKVQLSCKII